MSRLSKEELARFSGAEWAVRLVKDKGLEGAEKELESRGIRNFPLKLKDSDVDVFVQTERTNIANCLLLNTIQTLQDEFEFDKDMMERFVARWNKKVACIANDYTNWKEVRQTLYEETGIWVPLSKELEEE